MASLPVREVDFELAIIQTVGRLLPPIPHATAVINRILKPIYLRKRRAVVVAEAWGMKMKLNPHEAVDGGILFYPQLYNRKVFRWLDENLRPTDIFVDVGANIGAFALRARRTARIVVAIEANPSVFETLTENICLNGLDIHAVNKGVSDTREILLLSIPSKGNLGGSSFVFQHGGLSINVECVPLADIAPQIDVMKIDVEGMELKVLRPYFAVCRPRVIIMESFGASEQLAFCQTAGYRLIDQTAENVLLMRP